MFNWVDQQEKALNSHHLAALLIELAVNRGVNADRLLRGTQIFYQDLAKSSIRISAAQVFKLVENIEKFTETQELKFILGHRLYPGNFDYLSLALSNSKDLADALRIFNYYQTLIYPFLFVNTKTHQGKDYFFVNPAINFKHSQFFIDVLFTAFRRICKTQAKIPIPIEFCFARPKPKHYYLYEQNLGKKLCFDQHLNMIIIESHYLHHPFESSSSLLRKQQLATTRLKIAKQQIAPGLLQLIMTQIQRRKRRGLDINLSLTAELLDISPATLKRKLQQHGTSFQAIVDNMNKQDAIFELRYRQQSNADAAKSLEYSDLTNFRRALKRWTGLTPSQLKQSGN